MMQQRVVQLLLASLMATAIAPRIHAIPAFSGAEGPGSSATGGRGGDVYHVTNLEFDLNGVIPGSLKYGINTAPAAGRTIVFDVGGTIFQNGGGAQYWFRSGKSNITVAGQTAPGPGITIAGVGSKWTGDNVILRNVTVRPNQDPVNPTNYTYDAFSTQLTNSIIDHVSASWYSDEGISSTDAGYSTTVQYALIDEGLNYASHSFGSIISTEVDRGQLSFHHNLYAHNNSRVPRLGSEMPVTQTGAVTNFANNVIYNWINKAGYSGTDQPSSTNFLGNYYIKGNNNGSTLFTGGDSATYPGVTKIYHSGNLYDSNKNGVADGTAVTNSNFPVRRRSYPLRSTLRVLALWTRLARHYNASWIMAGQTGPLATRSMSVLSKAFAMELAPSSWILPRAYKPRNGRPSFLSRQQAALLRLSVLPVGTPMPTACRVIGNLSTVSIRTSPTTMAILIAMVTATSKSTSTKSPRGPLLASSSSRMG